MIEFLNKTVKYLQDHWAGVVMIYHGLDLLLEGILAPIVGGGHVLLPSAFDVAQADHLLGELPPGCADAWQSFWGWLTGNGCTAH